MAQVGGAASVELCADPAYPTSTPPDATFPGQTRAPLAGPLSGVVLPAVWSRVARPLQRCMTELQDLLYVRQKSRPPQAVALHYGRIALNAHAWESLRARALDEAPDPALAGPPPGGLQGWLERLDGLRARRSRRALRSRLREACEQSASTVRAAVECDPVDLDTLALARGPLHEPAWTCIVLPWLGLRLLGEDVEGPAFCVASAVALESRFAAELGQRLVRRGQLASPDGVGYLTVEERLRVAHETSDSWMKRVAERTSRVERFEKMAVPEQFWGRPRVDVPQSG